MNHCLFLGLGVFQAISCKQMPDNIMSLLRDLHTVLCPRSMSMETLLLVYIFSTLYESTFVLSHIAIPASG